MSQGLEDGWCLQFIVYWEGWKPNYKIHHQICWSLWEGRRSCEENLQKISLQDPQQAQ